MKKGVKEKECKETVGNLLWLISTRDRNIVQATNAHNEIDIFF